MGLAKVQNVLAAQQSRVIDEAASPALVEAFNCLRVAITVYDFDQRLIYANQHFDYLFRDAAAPRIADRQTYERLLRLEVGGGEIAARGAWRRYRRLRRAPPRAIHRRRSSIRSTCRLADGRIIEIKARRTPEGGWIALWTDATMARHATSRLENAIELSADAFAFFDGKDRLVVCNQDFCATLRPHVPADARSGDSPT